MRLICPRCDAQYQVPDDAIPRTGRDVQCSNCGETWYAMRDDDEIAAAAAELDTPPEAGPEAGPAATAEPDLSAEPGPDRDAEAGPAEPADAGRPSGEAGDGGTLAGAGDGDGGDEDAAVGSQIAAEAMARRRTLAPDVTRILREEAEREAQARRASSETFEDQPDLAPEAAEAPDAAPAEPSELEDDPAAMAPTDDPHPEDPVRRHAAFAGEAILEPTGYDFETDEGEGEAPRDAEGPETELRAPHGPEPESGALDDASREPDRSEDEGPEDESAEYRTTEYERAEYADTEYEDTEYGNTEYEDADNARTEDDDADYGSRDPVVPGHEGPAPDPRGAPAPLTPPLVAPVGAGAAARQEMLPDIHEINSSLQRRPERSPPPSEEPTPAEIAEKDWRRGFRLGFGIVVLSALGLALVYVLAPRIGEAVPSVAPALDGYVGTVDTARFWLDLWMQNVLDAAGA